MLRLMSAASCVLGLSRAFVTGHSRYSRLLSLSAGQSSDDAMKPFYALGVNVARQVGTELKGILTKDELAVMIAGFTASMMNTVEGDETAMLQQYGPKLNEILTERTNSAADKNKAAGEAFMTQYMLSNPKTVRTASGMLFRETVVGTGAQASLSSTVLVHYHGTLSDGTVFDSSVARGEPIKFPLKNVIKGWQEGVSLMKEGGKATLVVPSDLAYGDNGSPPVIPAGATLVFDVELISVIA